MAWHLVDSTTCDAVEAILCLRFRLADRNEAVAVARRQRDEARETVRSVRREPRTACMPVNEGCEVATLRGLLP
jgi:hypothetical protein